MDSASSKQAADGRQPDNGKIVITVGGQHVALYPNARYGAEAAASPAHLVLLERRKSAVEPMREVVAVMPREGIAVYATAARPAATEGEQQAVAAPVLPVFSRTPGGSDIVILSNRIIVQFKESVPKELIRTTLADRKLQVIEELSYGPPGSYLVAVAQEPDGLATLRAIEALLKTDLVLIAEPDLIEKRLHRHSVPETNSANASDRMWHLKRTGVPEAWLTTRGSPSICIAILDNGFDTQHPEFDVEVAPGVRKIAGQYDFEFDIADASPKNPWDDHGTACAGVAAAAGINMPGVAPECRMLLARLPAYLSSSDEARMFQWAADHGADVISCSWGPNDGMGIVYPLPAATRMAIQYCLARAGAGSASPSSGRRAMAESQSMTTVTPRIRPSWLLRRLLHRTHRPPIQTTVQRSSRLRRPAAVQRIRPSSQPIAVASPDTTPETLPRAAPMETIPTTSSVRLPLRLMPPASPRSFCRQTRSCRTATSDRSCS